VLLGVFLWGLFILTACQGMNLAGAAGAGGANKKVTLTDKDNGSSIALAVNNVFVVQLAGNPSTGYIWEANNLDTAHFSQIGNYSFSAGSHLAGASGLFTLTFKTLSSGKAVLRMIYHRSFEKGVPPLKSFEVTANIHN
jgi:inhibitor of cysteine peptidase